MTIDTNCLIAVEENRSEASNVRSLVEAYRQGKISLQVVAIAASENRIDKTEAPSFLLFQNRLDRIDMSDLKILKPICYWNVSYWGWCLYTDTKRSGLERAIHDILFPTSAFDYATYLQAQRAKLGQIANDAPIEAKWRNHKCDVLTMWAHIWHQGNVFVTSDRNFHKATKKSQLIALGAGEILYPVRAASILT